MKTIPCIGCNAQFEVQGETSPAICPHCRILNGLGQWASMEELLGETNPDLMPERDREPTLDVDDLKASFPELELKSLIGAGGMGSVFLARRISDSRSVALKILHESLAQYPQFVKRVEREASVLGCLCASSQSSLSVG